MPGAVEEPLDEALAAAERGDRLADRRLEQLGDLLQRAGHLQAAAAAAVGGLDRHRQAVLAGEGDHLVGAATGSGVPGTSGAPARCAMCRALTLSPRASMADGGGPIQISPASITACGEIGVLGEEAVAGVHGVGAGPAGDVEQLVLRQVGVGRGRAAEGVGLVGRGHVHRVAVGVGVHRHRGDAGVPAGPGDPDGDLAAVGDQDLGDGGRLGAGPSTSSSWLLPRRL